MFVSSRGEEGANARDYPNGFEPKEWCKAMNKETQALNNRYCWDEVESTMSVKALHTKFVLLRNCNHRRNINKFKARLVVCSDGEEKIDLDSVSLVVDFTVIKLLLCLVAQEKYKIRQLDSQNALSNRKLDRPFYAGLPK